ncbi:hypothetical protein O1611_g2052 [Lasiodiplodia mahajangana]|uniref:Uncharacterized protein n=1 Tax=Lasiodiplodia mahajangana TaxID=1108764 RepID=A0ACC2JVY5_9PEZI|nr:hypothetical protein O1611_g2052 [Lasiodiplodia mahajangana]
MCENVPAERSTHSLMTAQHHPSGKHGATCRRFPTKAYVNEEASGGTNNLEVKGFSNFRHVRCPKAPPFPCNICGRYSLHFDSLVVAVDGACPGNGTPNATKSAYGVFFGDDLPDNIADRVPDIPGYSHTNQRAEIIAAIAAIQASREYIYNGGQWPCNDCPTPCAVTHLVIKTDSAYLVNSMTAYIENWRRNGWRTAKGAGVKNKDLWTCLYNLVRLLHDERGVAIDFWHVPRDQNKDADDLANQGLG